MNLKGWDIISVTPIDHLNKTIAERWEKRTFDMEREGSILQGEFDKWYFTWGGGGKTLRIACPLLSGTFRNGSAEIVLDGMGAIFSVMLNFSDSISAKRQNDEKNVLSLMLDCRQPRYLSETGCAKNDFGEDVGGIVQPIDLIGCSSVQRYAILNMLTDYIIENQQWLQEAIFANVVLKGKQGNWLSPALCRYSVLDGLKPYIAILAVCTERPISNLPLDVDIGDLDLGSGDSFYAVSKELFLKEIGISCFTKMFRSSAGDYELTEGVLSNVRSVAMSDITVGAIDYTPYVRSREAQMKIGGSQLYADLRSGGCDLYAGIEMFWSSFNTFSCRYEEGMLKFTKERSSFQHSEDIPWYLRFIPLSFIIDICVFCISDSLASGIRVNVDIGDAALNEIQWHGAGRDIKSAFLNDGLVIRF